MRRILHPVSALLALVLLFPAFPGLALATERWGVVVPEGPVAPEGQAVIGVRGLPEAALRGAQCEVKDPSGRIARLNPGRAKGALRPGASAPAPAQDRIQNPAQAPAPAQARTRPDRQGPPQAPARLELRYPADFEAKSPMRQGIHRVRWRAGRDCRQAHFLVLDARNPLPDSEALLERARSSGRCR